MYQKTNTQRQRWRSNKCNYRRFRCRSSYTLMDGLRPCTSHTTHYSTSIKVKRCLDRQKDASCCCRILVLLPAVYDLARDHRHCCAHCRSGGATISKFEIEQDRDDATNDLELIAHTSSGDHARLLSRAPNLRVSVARFVFKE